MVRSISESLLVVVVAVAVASFATAVPIFDLVDDCSDCEDEDCSPLGLLYCDLFCEESDEQEAEEQTTKPQGAGSMGVTEKPPEEISKAPEEQQTPAGQAAGATEATAG